MNYPDNYYFTLEREWIDFLDEDTANIGLTEFAIRVLEPIRSIEIHTVGQTLRKNQVFGRVKNDTTLCKLIMPFDGIIHQANTAYIDNPDFINGKFNHNHWIVKVKLILPVDKSNLVTLDKYKAHKTDKMFHLITYLLPRNIK